jgi:hypothetical protein
VSVLKFVFSGVLIVLINTPACYGQLTWKCVDSLFQPLPSGIRVFQTSEPLHGRPNRAFYLIANLKDKSLEFATDTTYKRRLTPSGFYKKNQAPVVVVNGTFFSFKTQRNLNVVIKKGKMLAFNIPSVYNPTDSIYHYVTRSAIGIDKKGRPDVAWLYTDSVNQKIYSLPKPTIEKGKDKHPSLNQVKGSRGTLFHPAKKRWRMQTAIGGGPVLIQKGTVDIFNKEEKIFEGNAINDKHPRTAMGYTNDGFLIVLVIEGRHPGIAEGASLNEVAAILASLQCEEAINLDGGGSSCMLLNGIETIASSDKEGQRAVPAVFIIKTKKQERP